MTYSKTFSLWRESLVGLAVGVFCVVVPLVHFVTGPLSPLIGGFVAGMRSRCRPWEALRIALTMAFVLSFLISSAAWGIARFHVFGVQELPASFFWVLAVIFLYCLASAFLSALLGGFLSRRKG